LAAFLWIVEHAPLELFPVFDGVFFIHHSGNKGLVRYKRPDVRAGEPQGKRHVLRSSQELVEWLGPRYGLDVDFLALLAHRASATGVVSASAQSATV